MRRLAAAVLALSVLPAGSWTLAFSRDGADVESCAMACGHAAGEASCCVVGSEQDAAPTMRTCDRETDRAPAVWARAVVPVAGLRLTRPGASGILDPAPGPDALSAPSRSPDHVPLSVS